MENSLYPVLRYHGRFLSVCAALLVANLLFFVYVAGGQKKTVEGLGKEYRAARRKAASPEKRDPRVVNYGSDKKALEAFRKSLPSVSGIAGQAEELFRYIEGAGVSTTMLRYRSTPVVGGLVGYSASFAVTGEYGALKRLLVRIHGSPGLFCIRKISFQRADGEERLVEMRVTLSTYFDQTREET